MSGGVIPAMPSEFSLIDRYLPGYAAGGARAGRRLRLVGAIAGHGIGDHHRHARVGNAFPARYRSFQPWGWKTLAVNLSDLGAMGAHRAGYCSPVACPRPTKSEARAFSEVCSPVPGAMILSAAIRRAALNLCITALGEVPVGRRLRRDAACVGDDLWVSWPSGLAALGLAQLQGRASLPGSLAAQCIRALQQPVPRVRTRPGAAWRVLGPRGRSASPTACSPMSGILPNAPGSTWRFWSNTCPRCRPVRRSMRRDIVSWLAATTTNWRLLRRPKNAARWQRWQRVSICRCGGSGRLSPAAAGSVCSTPKGGRWPCNRKDSIILVQIKTVSARPSLRFYLTHPARFVACGFGSGLSPFARGRSGRCLAGEASCSCVLG